MTGTVTRHLTDRRFGFLSGDEGKEYFFHRSPVEGLWFENLQKGDGVTFEEEQGSPKGPQARRVEV